MRKFPILLIFLLLALPVYPFWIWSPKTQKWKNPKYSALATPYLQYKEAEKKFEEGDYKRAYKEFRKLLIHYPDSKEAAEAQYYIARCLEKMEKPYAAFQEYQKLIDSYPNSQRINEAVEREYNIGEFFLNRESRQLLGMSWYDFVEHPSIEIFSTIVKKVPYSEYAPRAQYKLGIIFTELGRHDEAREAFQKVIDNYSDSEWAAPAKYQLAIATSKAFPGADYDSSYLEEATKRLDEFIKEHPEAQISSEAEGQLSELRNREAKKVFDIAEFYEKQNKYESAAIYYRKVMEDFPDSDYYDIALERLKSLDELIRRNITKSQLIKERKIEAAEAKRARKIRLKQEKLQQKEERIRKARELAEQRRQEKLEKIEAAKASKTAQAAESTMAGSELTIEVGVVGEGSSEPYE
jgi:outer membrane protein assembly factor BamD